MSGYQSITNRIEIREYSDKKVPKDQMKKILEVARMSPSAMNKQKWKFVVIEDPSKLEKLADVSKYASYVKDSSFSVAVFVEDFKYGTIDATRAISHMQLAAWLLEPKVGSCFNFGWNEDEVEKIIGSYKPYELFTIIPFGYPRKQQFLGKKKRKNWDEVIVGLDK